MFKLNIKTEKQIKVIIYSQNFLFVQFLETWAYCQ